MSSFTPVQEQEIAVLIRRETERMGVLVRQLQVAARPGQIFPTAETDTAIAATPGIQYCDGTILTSDLYPDLYAAIGTAYTYDAQPPGSFRVPDMRQRMPIGAGAVAGLITRLLGAYGGTQDTPVVAHNHGTATGSAGSHSHTVTDITGLAVPGLQSAALSGSGTGVYVQDTTFGPPALATNSAGSHTHNIATDGVSGVGTNFPPFVAINWFIKT